MKGSLSLGKVSRIDIKIHWTFFLIFVWVVFVELQQGGSLSSILFNAAFIVVLFACVVLHEFGHALMARRFGVTTRKITLLPIGGVASLEKIPEEPYQEFLVAIAGPLVNMVIAMLLFFVVPVQNMLELQLEEMLEELNRLSMGNFLFYLFLANAALVVFNLIPAFPMDGGRVLRALLAMYTDRVKATRIAAGIGQFIAVIFLLLGLFFNIFLIFIALFVFIGAYGENKMVQHSALLKGHKVQEAMLTNITFLHPEDSMQKVIEYILSGTERDFVVISEERAVGVLTHNSIMEHSGQSSTLVKEVMETDFKSISKDAPLRDVLGLMESGKARFYPVTNSNQELVGAIDMTNLNEFILLQSRLEF
jgi:Zn-dependent protease